MLSYGILANTFYPCIEIRTFSLSIETPNGITMTRVKATLGWTVVPYCSLNQILFNLTIFPRPYTKQKNARYQSNIPHLLLFHCLLDCNHKRILERFEFTQFIICNLAISKVNLVDNKSNEVLH